MNRIQDYSLKCMKVIKRQHEIIKRLSSISMTATNSPQQTMKIEKDINDSVSSIRSINVKSTQQLTELKINENLYKELAKKLKIIIASKDKELKFTRNTIETYLAKIEQLENYISILKEESRRTIYHEKKDEGSIYSSENEDAYCMKSVPINNKRYYDKTNIDSKVHINKSNINK